MNESDPIERSEKSRALVPRGAAWTPRAAAAPPPAPPGSQITLLFIWRSIVRWWKLALPLGLLLGGGLGGGLWLTMKPQYRAEAWLQIENHRPFIAFPGMGDQMFSKTQIELMRNPIVLGEVVKRPEIAQLTEIKVQPAPVEWLSDRVQVLPVNGSEIYQIKFEGPDPVTAQLIVNAVMDTYVEFQQAKTDKSTTQIIDLLERQKEQRISELERLQKNVREMTKQATGQDPGFVSPSKQVYFASESPVNVLRGKKADLEVERALLTAKLQTMLSQQAPEVPSTLVNEAIMADPGLRDLDGALAAAREKLKGYETTAKHIEKSELAISLKNEIALIQKRRADLEKERRAKYAEILMKKLASEREQKIADLKAEIKDHELIEKQQFKLLTDAQKDLEKLGEHAFNLEIARGDMAYAEAVRDKIAERVTVLRTEQNAPTQVLPIRRAEVPIQPATNPLKKVLVATLGGFTVPFALAVLWELRVRRISNVEQFATEISLPVVGEITTLPVRSVLPGRRSTDRFERHRSTFEESIAYIRTSLLLSDELRDLQVLAVASAISREGKSSLASQLAVSLANATGETTLLIDTDMRDPDMHEMFGIPLAPGLAEVLEHQASLDETIVTSWSRRVHLLPAGQLMRSPHVLLGSGAFHALLDEARARYRYIIVDSPPVLAASEALVVAKAADGTLLCTMRDISRVGQVRQAIDRLRTAGARPLGAVFSGVPPQNYAYKYGGYYNSPYARRTWTGNAPANEQRAEATGDAESA